MDSRNGRDGASVHFTRFFNRLFFVYVFLGLSQYFYIAMTEAEFEEKEYEAPLYHQLLGGSGLISTPGQVFENAFGYDAALEARNRIFWDLAGWPTIPFGIDLNSLSWDYAWKRLGRQRHLPSFHVNLLIQAKRPTFLKGRNSRFSGLGIVGSYWRFNIRKHQQELLEKLEDKLEDRAFIVYASPAFHTYNALDRHAVGGSMVEHSSFVTPSRMRNHKSWNYDQPGMNGVACSTLEGFTGYPDFYTELRKRIEIAETIDANSGLKQIHLLVGELIKEADENPIIQRFLQADEELFSNSRMRNQHDLRFIRVALFFRFAGLSWLVAGPEDSTWNT